MSLMGLVVIHQLATNSVYVYMYTGHADCENGISLCHSLTILKYDSMYIDPLFYLPGSECLSYG